MKKNRSSKKVETLDDVIKGGKANIKKKVESRGRPKSPVEKKQTAYQFPLDLIDKIMENCGGNKSFFAEQVFNEFFERGEYLGFAPKVKVKKKQTTFFLPVSLLEQIKIAASGNKSFFAEQVFNNYFERKGIK